MKIDFSRLDALRPTAAVPEGFEPVPEVETPFDSGYEAMYRAAWDFHLETDDQLRAAAGRRARRFGCAPPRPWGRRSPPFRISRLPRRSLRPSGRSWRDGTRGNKKHEKYAPESKKS